MCIRDSLYTSRKVLRYSEVNSGMEDTQEDVEDLRSYSVTGDELILFLDEARRERERCALAISAAKQKLPRNLDLEISLNKERHELIKKYRSLLDLRNLRRDYMDTSYKLSLIHILHSSTPFSASTRRIKAFFIIPKCCLRCIAW